MKKIKSVFVVDDDPINNVICKTLISTLNFSEEIHCFVKADDALQYLQNPQNTLPDIIFLDINMPEIDGWGFLERFEQLPNSIVNTCLVYMLSSSINRDDIGRAKNNRLVQDYIQKPLSPVSLEEVKRQYALARQNS